MAKTKKTKTIPLKRHSNTDWVQLTRRAAICLTVAMMLLVGAGVAIWQAHRYVDRRLAFYDHAPKVVLKERPAWMSDFLAEQIAATAQPLGAHSTFDHQLLVDVADEVNQEPQGVRPFDRIG
jgi:hypothetical protein